MIRSTGDVEVEKPQWTCELNGREKNLKTNNRIYCVWGY